jgi:predicted HicB family RNase H-like nuclease
MKLSQFVDALRSDLTAVAAVGDEATAEAAQKLAIALEGSVGLRLVDAFASAALELTAQLPAGRVEVRLAGRDPELVYVEEEEEEAPAEDFEPEEQGEAARITFRLPLPLKDRVESAAAREGISVNSWLVRIVRQALTPAQIRVTGKRITGFAKS